MTEASMEERSRVDNEDTECPGTTGSKAAISHTLSLPSKDQPTRGLARNRSLRATSSNEEKSSKGLPANSWSFDSMAKAVSIGMSAFGSGVATSVKRGTEVVESVGDNVVQGSKYATKVVETSTKAVGDGVMQGSKYASRVTIDVSKAAVSGTVNASKAVTTASCNAAKDTGKWLQDTTSQLLTTGPMEHTVGPKESLDTVSQRYGVSPERIIRVNSLRKRKIYAGDKIIIPEPNLAPVAIEEPMHPMEEVEAQCADNVLITLNTQNFSIIDEEPRHICLEDIKCIETMDVVPSLLPANKILVEKEEEEEEEEEEENKSELIFDHRVKVELESGEVLIFETSEEAADLVLAFMQLWFPMKCGIHTSCYVAEDDEGSSSAVVFARHMHGVQSHILDDMQKREQVHALLPDVSQHKMWRLAYSTERDGFSLQHFYRRLESQPEPFLLLVRDMDGLIFGSFLTCVPECSDEFLGTGSTFLFFLDPEHMGVKCGWSRSNEHFFQGRNNCLIIGASHGRFGIFVDGDLHRGRMQACDTFNKWPMQEKDFIIDILECFSLTSDDATDDDILVDVE